ncbi:hypothetical protein [Tamlana crocina]|uniref:Uncharacterized protein n=1 Tax=Tamlana crocina TaxID=393006 RepID=A0ABX1D7H7_9FLAO|nr:hypothetical protein [Tamlana crocina]NJX14291.1 hypothetical protein [Tamlana crocina]
MERRSFINVSILGGMGLLLPAYACGKGKSVNKTINLDNLTAFQKQCFNLLKTWCDAMIREQVNNENDPVMHGTLYCRACETVHGRAHDAVYPLMCMADITGDKKYLDAAFKLLDWSVNVDGPDGSWTNDVGNPDSWKGITVFGSIALGEALHYHGHLFSKEDKLKWEARLKKAIHYVYETFHMDYSHVNYRFTAAYGLCFLGEYFSEDKYIKRGEEFAATVYEYLTEPNKLMFGEDKPNKSKSKKGLYGIDLGYNVEESLNGIVQYAILKKDEKMLDVLTESMNGHLEFMLPDGAWDNSFGTRQNKWTYWGSRTADGCQPAFTLMADRNPAFGTAAALSTELLERCTVSGLLAGGLHYKSHGVEPCIHHTFAHAKSLAFVLDNLKATKGVNKKTPIPRSVRDGVEHFPELDVWLGARGPWRSTVSTYDKVWKKKYSVAGMGGALNVLWHEKVGPLFTASMAEYILVEPNNQQEQPEIDFCLTPRVERFIDGVWYTNIHDLNAKVSYTDNNNTIDFLAEVKLTNREKEVVGSDAEFKLNYLFDKNQATIKARRTSTSFNGDTLVLPLISPTGEQFVQVSNHSIEIHKKEAVVTINSNVPINIKELQEERVFNQVPGMEVLPIMVVFPQSVTEVVCTITVS